MEDCWADPKVAVTDRLKCQLQAVLLKEKAKLGLKKEAEKYMDEKYIPFRLVKEIHDVISDSGDLLYLQLHKQQIDLRTSSEPNKKQAVVSSELYCFIKEIHTDGT